MRKKTEWLHIGFQFLSFALVCLVLSAARWPFLVNIVVAFGLSLGLSWAYNKVRRTVAVRKAGPKRIRVVSIKTADD